MKKNLLLLLAIILLACNQPVEVVRHVPIIHSINLSRTIVYPEEVVDVAADITDEDIGDKLTYQWWASSGNFINASNNPTQWQAPDQPDTCKIRLTVSDGYFNVTDSTLVVVISR